MPMMATLAYQQTPREVVLQNCCVGLPLSLPFPSLLLRAFRDGPGPPLAGLLTAGATLLLPGSQPEQRQGGTCGDWPMLTAAKLTL